MPAFEGDATDGETVKDKDKEEDEKKNSVGDRERERGKKGEEVVEDVLSLAISKCLEVALAAEYDVIDLSVKPYLTGHTSVRPLRGAGRAKTRTRVRASKGDEHDTHYDKEMIISVDEDKYNDDGKDCKERVKINDELNRSEKDSRMVQYVKKDRDGDRMSLKEGEKEVEGEGGSEHPASAVIGSRPRSRSLSSSDSSKKRLYLHSSPLSALCSADHVRHHTAFR